MARAPPRRRLHALRNGDGPRIPSERPDVKWPELSDLEPYWESFQAFALSELTPPVSVELRMMDDGTWGLWAEEDPSRRPEARKSLKYDPVEDEIRFRDPEVDGGWVMESAFGGDPFEATSRL